METPIAFKIAPPKGIQAFRVRLDPAQRGLFKPAQNVLGPAIIVMRSATILTAASAGVVDADDIVTLVDGDWSEAVLIVLPNHQFRTSTGETEVGGDAKFLSFVKRVAPELLDFATEALQAVRAAGVEGHLVETKLGRWMNRPLNTFTLKPQPRAGNLHFTLYGNPESYSAGEFLKKDQNSYSRGWIRNSDDIELFAKLVQQSHARRSS